MSANQGSSGKAPESMTYEELVEALEDMTDRMSAGDIGIEQAADLYEQAGLLHALATEKLAKVQERIRSLQASSKTEASNS